LTELPLVFLITCNRESERNVNFCFNHWFSSIFWVNKNFPLIIN